MKLRIRTWQSIWEGLRRQTQLSSAFLLVVVVAICFSITGCATPPSALTLLPDTGSNSFKIREYPLVEQSKDNPNHLDFQKRVQAAVASQKAGWQFPSPQDDLTNSNQLLSAFGYRLEANSTPPFSGYSLYQQDHLVQPGIARFWPVSVKNGNETDFLLPFETLAGERMVANQDGIHPWPGNGPAGLGSPPVYLGGQIAYAATGSGKVSVYAGGGLLYTGTAPNSSHADHLLTWNDSTKGSQHWALEINNNVIVDGQDLNRAQGYQDTFHYQILNGKPFYFYTRDGLTHLSYDGRDLAYTYDKVVHGNNGDTAVFNPGGNDRIVWFYALRDGLWYYVEAGNIE